MNNIEESIKVRDAAMRLGVSTELLRKEIRAGRLPAMRSGPRLTLIPVKALQAWYESRFTEVGKK